jgi:capsular exopolysaccharide synthesis family protein
VLVTSAEPGAGKSTIAANLAVVSALGGARVLLVDADLPRPVQHNIFGLPRGPGLVDYLASGGGLDAFVQAGPAKLDILTVGREVSRMAEILSSPRMTELFETGTDQYDAVIVDTAPVLASADAAAIATSAGLEVLFVVTRTTRRHDVTRALRRLELVHAPIAGLVLNREGQQDTYGYGV